MRRWILTFAAVTFATLAGSAVAYAGPATVDLRDAAALEQLRDRNPAHFATIQRILAGLAEKPERVEGDWLRTTFDARDVELSRLLLKTSHPPRQQLRFTLDDTRYTLHVVRSDLAAEPQVLR
ncbi:MAG TPA: hypothetical protein VFX69_10750 [Steroidobacteraceae bacterium]|nr:hypothetical protein [Steroidobacteraceae bacterium]